MLWLHLPSICVTKFEIAVQFSRMFIVSMYLWFYARNVKAFTAVLRMLPGFFVLLTVFILKSNIILVGCAYIVYIFIQVSINLYDCEQ